MHGTEIYEIVGDLFRVRDDIPESGDMMPLLNVTKKEISETGIPSVSIAMEVIIIS